LELVMFDLILGLSPLVLIVGVGGAVVVWLVRSMQQAHLAMVGLSDDPTESYRRAQLRELCGFRGLMLWFLVPILVVCAVWVSGPVVESVADFERDQARQERWASDSDEVVVLLDVPFRSRRQGAFDSWIASDENQAFVERWFGSVQGYLRRQRELDQRYAEVPVNAIEPGFYLNYDKPGFVERLEARHGSLENYIASKVAEHSGN
jgi:hypothetical protein